MRHVLAWGLVGLGLLSAACTINAGITPSGEPTPSKKPAANQDPIIHSLTAHRFVTATESVALWVQASDLDCDPLKVSWSVTEGLLSSTVGTDVTLTSAATRSTSFISTVQVSVSDGRGGSAQGSLNVKFSPEGYPMMAVEATASPPVPEPCSTPPSDPAPSSQPTPSPSPSVTPMPVQQDGRTFFLDVVGNNIMVQPVSLTVASGTSGVRFKAMRGTWEVVSLDQAVAPGISKRLGTPGHSTEGEFPVWQLFDIYPPQMRFEIYYLLQNEYGSFYRHSEPLRVLLTK